MRLYFCWWDVPKLSVWQDVGTCMVEFIVVRHACAACTVCMICTVCMACVVCMVCVYSLYGMYCKTSVWVQAVSPEDRGKGGSGHGKVEAKVVREWVLTDPWVQSQWSRALFLHVFGAAFGIILPPPRHVSRGS